MATPSQLFFYDSDLKTSQFFISLVKKKKKPVDHIVA